MEIYMNIMSLTAVELGKRIKAALSSQDVFCKEAMEAVPKPSHGHQGRVYIPAEPVE